MAAIADLLRQKLQALYPSGDTNIGSLRNRYRDDQNVETWGGYVDHVSPSALHIPNNAAGSCSTPDHASFAFSTFDVRVLLQMDCVGTWKPEFLSAHIIGQEGANNSAWTFSIHPDSIPRTAVLANGTDIVGDGGGNAPIPFMGGPVPYWARTTFLGNNGSGSKEWGYYTAPYDGTLNPSFTQLGTTITESGTVTLFNSTAPLTISNLVLWSGRVYYAEVRSSINGTIVANPDFRGLAPGTTSFADSTGKTWTVAGAASINTAPISFADHENAFWTAF